MNDLDIKKIRTDLGLTQVEFAKRLGISMRAAHFRCYGVATWHPVRGDNEMDGTFRHESNETIHGNCG